MGVDDMFDPPHQIGAVLLVVEADRQSCRGARRDHISRRIAHGDIGHLDVRRLEPVIAVIERDRVDLGQHRHQFGDRIVGELRIGNMPLTAGHFDPDVDRSAPPDLDRIAEPIGRGRFADEAQIGLQPALRQPIEDRAGAVDRRAFLVAGEQQADDALAGGTRGGGDEGGDRALHVDRAAPVEQIAANFGREGARGPAFARRHDIEMPGEGEMRAAGAAHRDHILDRPVGRLADREAIDREAERGEQRLHRVEHMAGGRGHAFASDQCFGQSDRIG